MQKVLRCERSLWLSADVHCRRCGPHLQTLLLCDKLLTICFLGLGTRVSRYKHSLSERLRLLLRAGRSAPTLGAHAQLSYDRGPLNLITAPAKVVGLREDPRAQQVVSKLRLVPRSLLLHNLASSDKADKQML